MKKVMVLSMMMLIVMGLFVFVSCGDDDENGNGKVDLGGSTIVDGVNVANGKKLVRLMYLHDKTSSYYWGFNVHYDSKGRISKIFLGSNYQLLEIDYDLRIYKLNPIIFGYFEQNNNSKIYSFALNKDGYISLLGNTILKYDSNGFLSSIDSPEGLATLSLANDDYLKASLSSLMSGEMQLLYVTFGDVDNKGEIYFRINRYSQQKSFSDYASDEYERVSRKAICLILYQSGLLGKVVKGFLHLKDEKEASAFFNYEETNNQNKYMTVDGKISFEFE